MGEGRNDLTAGRAGEARSAHICVAMLCALAGSPLAVAIALSLWGA